MKNRTQTEIEAEIKALEGCKKYAPHYSVFGTNNWRNIDLQIELMEGDIDTTAAEFEEEFDDDEQSVIMEAQYWMEGSSPTSPSSGWDSFKPKQ